MVLEILLFYKDAFFFLGVEGVGLSVQFSPAPKLKWSHPNVRI